MVALGVFARSVNIIKRFLSCVLYYAWLFKPFKREREKERAFLNIKRTIKLKSGWGNMTMTIYAFIFVACQQ